MVLDESGAPGSILTFFEFPGAAPGRHGAGMAYRILWRVADGDALGFWRARLADDDVAARSSEGGGLRFDDPEGLEHELVVVAQSDAPLVADSPDVPGEHALQGFHGVRAYTLDPPASAPLLEALGFAPSADPSGSSWEVVGQKRHAQWHYDPPPSTRPLQGAGSIRHVAWSAADDAELTALRERTTGAGARATPITDRQYFHSVYFREPSGLLFELATRDIGFDIDEPAATLGAELKLPRQHEAGRVELERALTPLVNPRG